MKISFPTSFLHILKFALAVAILIPCFSFAIDEIKPALPIEEFRLFTNIYTLVKSQYVDPLEDKKLIDACLSGMVSGVDPQSAYLDSDSFNELKSMPEKTSSAGLGLEVMLEGGFVKIVSAIEGGPAFNSGISSGDLLYKIDDAQVIGMPLKDVVKRMRGPVNTLVRLTILRKDEKAPIVFTMKREILQTQSVRSQIVESVYAYVRITRFQELTGANLVEQLQPLFQQAEIKGLILDLRENPGGLFSSGIDVASIFLPPNTLVLTTDGRTEDSKQRYSSSSDRFGYGMKPLATPPAKVKDVQMVVLVNKGSAAASEIVAGALQDHKRAVIMGSRTFGRASIQTIFPAANNTAVKLTTARWFTPKGHSIHLQGITPDVLLESDTKERGTTNDIQLKQALSIFKSLNAPGR